MVRARNEAKRYAARRWDSIVDEALCREIEAGDGVFSSNGDPDFAVWGDREVIETTRAASEWRVEGGKCFTLRVKAEEKTIVEGCGPDRTMGVADDLHKRTGGIGHGEAMNSAGFWIETP